MNSVPAISPNNAQLPRTYLLQDATGAVKIGWTSNLLQRTSSLQVSSSTKLSLIRLLDGGTAIEKWMHKRFAPYRLTGEWFKFHPEMLTVRPPEEFTRLDSVIKRRDIRLTLKERLRAVDAQGDELGLSPTQVLALIAASMTDAEARAAIEMIGESS